MGRALPVLRALAVERAPPVQRALVVARKQTAVLWPQFRISWWRLPWVEQSSPSFVWLSCCGGLSNRLFSAFLDNSKLTMDIINGVDSAIQAVHSDISRASPKLEKVSLNSGKYTGWWYMQAAECIRSGATSLYNTFLVKLTMQKPIDANPESSLSRPTSSETSWLYGI